MKKFKIDTSKLAIGHPISIINPHFIESSNKFKYTDLPIKIGYFGIFTDGVRDPYNYLNKEQVHLKVKSIIIGIQMMHL